MSWEGLEGRGAVHKTQHSPFVGFYFIRPLADQKRSGWRKRVSFGRRRQAGEKLEDVLREPLGIGRARDD